MKHTLLILFCALAPCLAPALLHAQNKPANPYNNPSIRLGDLKKKKPAGADTTAADSGKKAKPWVQTPLSEPVPPPAVQAPDSASKADSSSRNSTALPAPKPMPGVYLPMRRMESALAAPAHVDDVRRDGNSATYQPAFLLAWPQMAGAYTPQAGFGLTAPGGMAFNAVWNPRVAVMADGVELRMPATGAANPALLGPAGIDLARVEYVAGASSAQYGSQAFTGAWNYTTRDPFTDKGLSASLQAGALLNGGISPGYTLGLRYAQSMAQNRVAFKMAFEYTGASSNWQAAPSSDAASFAALDSAGGVRRFSRAAYAAYAPQPARLEIMRGEFALLGLVKRKHTLSYRFRFGGLKGQAYEPQANAYNRAFVMQHLLEAKGADYFVRFGLTMNVAGGYDNAAAAGAANLNAAKADSAWAADFRQAWGGSAAGVQAWNEAAARQFADTARHARSPGAGWNPAGRVQDNSRLWNIEAQYDFTRLLKKAINLALGGQVRVYELRSAALFGDTAGQGLTTAELSIWAHAHRAMFRDRVRLLGGFRYDHNLNFAPGRFSARGGLNVLLDKQFNHALRADFNLGWRFPTPVEQLAVQAGGWPGAQLGGLPTAWGPAGLQNLALYTLPSAQRFGDALAASMAGGTYDAAYAQKKSLLQPWRVDTLKPERVYQAEIGYRGVVRSLFYIDASYRFAYYTNLITAVPVAVTSVNRSADLGATPASPAALNSLSPRYAAAWVYANVAGPVYAHSFLLSARLALPKTFALGASYAYFRAYPGFSDANLGLNTPPHSVTAYAGAADLKGFGFALMFRYVQGFAWQSPAASGSVPAWHTLNAEVFYKVKRAGVIFKLGAANLYNNRHMEYAGGPQIGGYYYATVVFESGAIVKKEKPAATE